MKRQRSYGDGLDDDRRRFYDRGPPPPPPPSRRPSREYEADRFDRRKGFGGGRGGVSSPDNQYREYQSPREYGGDRALHRSESFSGFRREFPNGFRLERDRPRRDGHGSSSWRRSGGGWRDAEGSGEYRAPARLSGASLPVPPQRSRSPIEPRRRFEVAKADKLRKQSASVNEMEEGEVAPDADHKTRPAAAVEHRKQVQPSHAKEKGAVQGELKKVESSRVSVDLGTYCKEMAGASHSDNTGSEQGKRRDDLMDEAGTAMDKGREKSALKFAEEGEGRHEMKSQDVAASDAGKFGLSTSPMQREVMQEKVNTHEETTNSIDAVEQSTSSSIMKVVIQEEATVRAETTDDIDGAGKTDTSSLKQDATQEEVVVLHKIDSADDEVGKSISRVTRQEVLQEQALVLDGTGSALDDVGKSVSSGMLEEVRKEEVMQHDGTANGVNRIEIGTSSGLLQEEMQEKIIPLLDETANTVDAPQPVSYSGLMKEAMHDEYLALDGVANTIGLVGQFDSSDMVKDTVALEGITNVVDVAGESNMSTGLQEEVMACLHQQALESKDSENLTVTEENISEPKEYDASQPAEDGRKMDHSEKRGAPEETTIAEEAIFMHENVEKPAKSFDMVVETENTNVFLQLTTEHAGWSKEEATNVNVMTREPRAEDKETGIAFDILGMKGNVDCAKSVGRGVDSTLQLRTEPAETSKPASTTIVKQEHDTIKIEKLDLSLSLSDCFQNSESKYSTPKTGSLVHATCSQPLPSSSFCTNLDGLTTSMSFSNSKTPGHNPSCSLTHQSTDNYEHSVSCKPMFMGVDQMSNRAGRKAQLSSEYTKKGANQPLHTVQINGHVSDNTLVGLSGHNNGTSKDYQRLGSISGVLSPTHSHGSQNSRLEHIRFRRQLTREGSSNSLTMGERQEGQQLVINGAGVIERVISKVVSEPFHHTAMMLQKMTENSITFLREAISDIIVNPDKRGQIIALQEALKKRSDLNNDLLQTCPQVLMEILVAIRTGLPYFIKKSSNVAKSDLVDIFLNLKCRNLSCRSVLPVDDCDCQICQWKTGFCSSCMCVVCSKFDLASNTCSWVGCDVCLHWCHTDCGLRHSLIRKGDSSLSAHNITEVQFHCAACGHPSEMFGFVKEVFRTCARQWRMDTLVRELRYVERIFSCGDDTRGQRVCNFVKQMLIKLENKAYYPEVVKCVTAFFSDDDVNLGIGPSEPLRGIPCSIAGGDGITSSSRMAAWKPYTLEGLPVSEKATVLSTTGSPSLHRASGETKFLAADDKPVIDELDSLIRLKQAESYMFQERANDARNQADDLRHIVMVKTARIEEDYATQIVDLNINELQERRKQKMDELQEFERTYRQFFSMKTRMETSIRKLLLKLEPMKRS
ncbi:hypothetical protein EJB05_07531, partial [Eragrostis curvula]